MLGVHPGDGRAVEGEDPSLHTSPGEDGSPSGATRLNRVLRTQPTAHWPLRHVPAGRCHRLLCAGGP